MDVSKLVRVSLLVAAGCVVLTLGLTGCNKASEAPVTEAPEAVATPQADVAVPAAPAAPDVPPVPPVPDAPAPSAPKDHPAH